ncbi:MAG: rod-binding protein [Pseudomonadota bacterium]
MPVLPPIQQPSVPESGSPDARLRAAAVQLEATFLAEMLKTAGLGEVPGAFGGGAGEEQFASFLRDTQAQAMAEAGGIGLAEALFEALKVRLDA